MRLSSSSLARLSAQLVNQKEPNLVLLINRVTGFRPRKFTEDDALWRGEERGPGGGPGGGAGGGQGQGLAGHIAK